MCAAVSIAAVGVAVSVLTGGTALPIYMAAAAVTLGSGGTAASMGISDVLEGVQDICYGSTGSETASTNLIRDYVYQGNYDVYYLTEIGSVMVASQGMAILGNVPKSEGAGSAGGIVTKNGIKIEGFTSHGVDRAIGDGFKRAGVKPDSILDALKNPLKTNDVVTDSLGRNSQRFIGKTAEVVINPDTGKIISVNPTSSSKAAKLLKELEGLK